MGRWKPTEERIEYFKNTFPIKFNEELDGASKFINKYVDNLLNKYYSNYVLDITYLINEEDYIL